jgi:predicted ATPase
MLYEATSRAGVQHQVIAETHSEQMVLRLQRRIREKSIKSSEVSVIYVSAIPDSGSVFQELQFDENGVMDEWPRGFSDFRLEEILG